MTERKSDTAGWGEECATCGSRARREDDLFCSDKCAAADWMSVARAPSDGRLVSGYEGRSCAADHCQVPLTVETGAFLHKNRGSGKLAIFCEACSMEVQMNHALRLPLVAL